MRAQRKRREALSSKGRSAEGDVSFYKRTEKEGAACENKRNEKGRQSSTAVRLVKILKAHHLNVNLSLSSNGLGRETTSQHLVLPGSIVRVHLVLLVLFLLLFESSLILLLSGSGSLEGVDFTVLSNSERSRDGSRGGDGGEPRKSDG